MNRTKTCKECGEIKPITAFPKNGFDRKTGLQKYALRCRRCHNVYQQDLLYKRREKEFEQKQAVMAALMDAEREKEEAAKARSIAQSVVLAKAACPILHIGLWTEPLFIPKGMLQI